MRKIQSVKVEQDYCADILCDMCDKSCWVDKDNTNPAFATLGVCGNFDFHDQTHLKCDLCSDCFDKVVAFIISQGGRIRKCNEGLTLTAGCELCDEDRLPFYDSYDLAEKECD